MWEECFAAANNGLKIKDKEAVYTMDPKVWGYALHDLLAISAHHLGLKDKAIEHGQIACQMESHDERLKNNLTYYASE
jgi:hypothetical protein